MAQLWGGRFTGEMDSFVNDFNASILFDSRMYAEDIEGSIAHAEMLAAQGILTEAERDAILQGLRDIRADLDAKKIPVTTEYEDIHSLVESELIRRIGDAGKKLHTGRSRNDQSATDVRMYLRKELLAIRGLLTDWIRVLADTMEQHLETWMPGFTHLQKAQPVTLAHHLGCYVEMALRDSARIDDALRRVNVCPLGSAALAGTTYPLDREYTARRLGFSGPCANSMDGVSDRDHICESAFCLALIMTHLSRFCEEIILWSSNEYRFIELSDGYCTGSSIMPQKKNPDMAELIRGKTGRVYGALTSELTMLKGLPLSFSKDMQEDKEVLFDAIDTVKNCLTVAAGMLATASFRKDVMAKSAARGFINATDAADYLVSKGVPFRDAHRIAGQLVLRCIDLGCELDTLPLAEYRALCPAFDEDIYRAIDLETCVRKRTTAGSPNPDNVRKVLESYRAWLKAQEG